MLLLSMLRVAVLVSDKEAYELEELLPFVISGYGETDQFAAALQVTRQWAGDG
jgi:maltodextrin utilization protein YvdJ